MPFALTAKQAAANEVLASDATHILLYGGGRSGKTLLILRAIALRALKAPGSRHASLRFRFNHAKETLALDTWPKMASLCFPGVPLVFNKSDWFVEFPNGSEYWIGGLDDKERTEKILGKEFATLHLNECSQIPYVSRALALTRLAQKVTVEAKREGGGKVRYELPLRCYYDENPPDKGHWSYRLFVQKVDPDTRRELTDPERYAAFGPMNPADNIANISAEYLREMEHSAERIRRRFLLGMFRDENPNALFAQEHLDKWRVTGDAALPDFVRVVVAVDPSGSGDVDNADNDAIGIVVAALGTDGNGYCLEDLTVRAGPATWGRIATDAYERHRADVLVAEVNFGGAMVRSVIQAARPRTNYKELRASRGKAVRAEPISSLCETGKVRLCGYFPHLEDELAGFTVNGYIGEGSPNRADAFVWAFSELFPGLVRERREPAKRHSSNDVWSWG